MKEIKEKDKTKFKTKREQAAPGIILRADLLLFVDVDLKPRFEPDGKVVIVNGDLLDQLSDEAFVEFGDFGLLTSAEVLQLLDPVHDFFPVITIDLGLFFLVAEPENLISDGIVWL